MAERQPVFGNPDEQRCVNGTARHAVDCDRPEGIETGLPRGRSRALHGAGLQRADRCLV
jgi:hypothetical protein